MDPGAALLRMVKGEMDVPYGYELGPPEVVDGKGGTRGSRGKGKRGKGDDDDDYSPPSFSKGKGKGKGKSKGEGKGKGKGEAAFGRDRVVDQMIEASCGEDGLALEPQDFDFRARRFLHELLTRPGAEETGTARVQKCIDLCVEVARTKERDDVDNWRAYIFKLLRKEDGDLYDELRERDIRRRRQDGQ